MIDKVTTNICQSLGIKNSHVTIIYIFTGGADNSEQHLLVTPSPTTVSSIDPKLLLVQSPKETDTNGSEQPVTLVPATSLDNPETSAEVDQTPSNNGAAIPIAEPIVSATAAPAVTTTNSQTSQAQPVFYLAPLIMPLLANSQGSSSSTPSLTTTSAASLAALAQLGQLTTSPANSPQLIPIQNLLADAQSKVRLEQLISPEALKLLDQSADGFKCTWKLDVKPSPVVSPSMSPGQVPTDSNVLLVQTPGEDKKGKRKRQVFSGFQTDELEGVFQVSAYVSAVERERLAQKVGLSPDQVKVWFQNRRTKKYRSSWRKSKQGSGQLPMDGMEASPLAMDPGQLPMDPGQLSMDPTQLVMKSETGEPS